MNWQKCNVVLLPTKQESKLVEIDYYNVDSREPFLQYNDIPSKFTDKHEIAITPMEMYILSNEEIKEGDWVILSKVIGQCTRVYPLGKLEIKFVNGFEEYYKDSFLGKKIIATTNSELTIYNIRNPKGFDKLPSVSDNFIKQYCNNPIDKVLVEYKEIEREVLVNPMDREYSPSEYIPTGVFELIINSDNTIQTKSIKESWNREEVKQICDRLFDELYLRTKPQIRSITDYEEWIKENLN